MTICSAVLIQYQRVTDGRTDGRTDVQPISITCFSIADARKNYDDMLIRFHTIPACHGRTDRQTDRIAISISRVSVLTRDKKTNKKPVIVLHTRHLKEDNGTKT